MMVRKVTTVAALVVVAVLVTSGCGGTGSAAPTTTAAKVAAPVGPHPTTFAEISKIVSTYNNMTAHRTSICELSAYEKGGKLRTRSPGLCAVQLTIPTIVFGTEREILHDIAPVFRELFAKARDPHNVRVGEVFIAVYGPIEHTGGKTSIEIAMNADCTREAANQIDWDVISTSDFEQLCIVRKFIRFS